MHGNKSCAEKRSLQTTVAGRSGEAQGLGWQLLQDSRVIEDGRSKKALQKRN